MTKRLIGLLLVMLLAVAVATLSSSTGRASADSLPGAGLPDGTAPLGDAPLDDPLLDSFGNVVLDVFGNPVSDPKASGWHIGYYTPSGRTLSYAEAFTGSGEASLNFTMQDNTALLVTSQKAKFPTLLGDLSEKSSISASLTVSDVTGLFTYYGEPSCSGPPPDLGPLPNVRFFFQTSNAGGFDETHYWWSNPVSWPLTNGSMTLTNSFDGAFWSDYYGHFGNNPSYSAGFEAALSNVTTIGVSFGGGCFFENGVGTTDGSGSFTIDSFTVNQ